MAFSPVVVLCLVSFASGLVNPGGASLLSFDTVDAKKRPVSKVIVLLKDMQKQMEKDAAADEEVYDKMACWCETNDKEKTKAIADAEARISDLTTKSEEHAAASLRLGAEIKDLEADLASDQKALDASIALRLKQSTEFAAEEKDLVQSISALKSAVVVLGKHNSKKSLLQVPKSHLLGVAATIQHELSKHLHLLQGVITPSARRTIGVFVQSPEDFLNDPVSFRQEYAPQSGEIFGILSQMKETFETNLAESQKNEKANQKAHEDCKKAKQDQIAAAQAQLDTKTQEVADADEKNAQAKQDKEDTANCLAADQKFLASLKQKCATNDAEWEQRQKTRQSEIQAVSKALSVLSSDDAHDTFTKTFNPTSFVQRHSKIASRRRAEAAQVLVSMSVKNSSPRLSALAEQIRIDAFTNVKAAIDNMVKQLTQEKEDETKEKDYCVDAFNNNVLETEKEVRNGESIASTIQDLELTFNTQWRAIAALNAEIAELGVQLKKAGEDRVKQNKESQVTIADQRASQRLLEQALTVLKSYYTPKPVEKTTLVQASRASGAAAEPPGFTGYKNNAGSAPVMMLIQKIIADAKAMEVEAVKAEEDAQKAYETFVADTNACVEGKNKDVVHKTKIKAKAEADLVQARSDRDASATALEQLGNTKTQLHARCDYLMKGKYDLRAAARDEEIDALKQAKAVLSGASFTALLQRSAE